MAKKRIIVRSYTISDEEAKQFIDLIKNELRKLDSEELDNVYLFDHSTQSIILSIDSNWKPFIGFTRGWNYPQNRKLFKEEIGILDLVIDSLYEREYDTSGGRIFLSRNKVLHKQKNYGSTLCTFTWYGKDPFKEIFDYYVFLQRAS